MTNKTRVKINVCGTDYHVISGENIEYVKRLGEEIDKHMYGLLQNNPRMSTTQAAILSCISFADERKKAVETADHLREQMKDYMGGSSPKSSSTKDDSSKEALKLANEEIAALKSEIDYLKKQLSPDDEAFDDDSQLKF